MSDSDLDLFLTSPPSVPEADKPEPATEAPETTPAETAAESPPPEGETDDGESPAPEQEAKAEQPRDERGRFKKSPEEYERESAGLRSAMLAEREKRQALEREREEERQRREAEPMPDWFDNPDKAFEARFQAQQDNIRSAARAEARQMFLNMSEDMMRGQHADYDQVREVFVEEIQRNPALQAEFAAAPNPAAFVYRQGKVLTELREVGGDLGKYRERVEADVRKRIEAEIAAKAKRQADIPKSLNSESSEGAGVSGKSSDEVPSLESLVHFNY